MQERREKGAPSWGRLHWSEAALVNIGVNIKHQLWQFQLFFDSVPAIAPALEAPSRPIRRGRLSSHAVKFVGARIMENLNVGFMFLPGTATSRTLLTTDWSFHVLLAGAGRIQPRLFGTSL